MWIMSLDNSNHFFPYLRKIILLRFPMQISYRHWGMNVTLRQAMFIRTYNRKLPNMRNNKLFLFLALCQLMFNICSTFCTWKQTRWFIEKKPLYTVLNVLFSRHRGQLPDKSIRLALLMFFHCRYLSLTSSGIYL